MDHEGYESDQQVAGKLRGIISAGGFIGDARELLLRYQRRCGELNARLASAASWLRLGHISEAIGAVEEYPDAIDTARDLDLGRERFARLVQECQRTGLEIPTGPDLHSAWELSNAFVLYVELKPLLDRYRSACMTGEGVIFKLRALRSACQKATACKALIGPAGDTVERMLARQSRMLIDQRINEFKLEARNFKFTPGSEQVEGWRLALAEFDQIITDLNLSGAQIPLDFAAKPAFRPIQSIRDTIDLDSARMSAPELIQRNDIDGLTALRDVLRQITDRGIVEVPAWVKDLHTKINAKIAEQENRRSESEQRHEELWKLIRDPASTQAARAELYEAIVGKGAGRVPADLETALATRDAQDLDHRKARRRRTLRITVVSAAALLLVGAALTFYLLDLSRRTREAEAPAMELARVIEEDLDAGRIGEATTRLEQATDDHVLGQPVILSVRKRVAEANAHLEKVKLELENVRRLTGFERGDLQRILTLEGLLVGPPQYPRVDDQTLEEARSLIALRREDSDAAFSNESAGRQVLSDVAKRLESALGLEASKGADWVRVELEACRSALVAALDLKAYSQGFRSELEARQTEVANLLDEVKTRLEIAEAIASSESTVDSLLDHYNRYVNLPAARSQYKQPLELVLRDAGILRAASEYFRSIGSSENQGRPSDVETARRRASLCEPAYAGLLPPGAAAPQSELYSYFESYVRLHGEGVLESFNAIAEELELPKWKALGRVIATDGIVYYTAGGELRHSAEGQYSLSEVLKFNAQFDGGARVRGNPLLAPAPPREIEDLGLARLAATLAEQLRQARALEHEPLTVLATGADAFASSRAPTPLKAAWLRRLTDLQAQFSWPALAEMKSISAAIASGGESLGEKATWSPTSGEKDIAAAHAAFESALDRLPGFGEQFALAEQRIRAAIHQIGSVRAVGVAWKAGAGGVSWLRADGEALPTLKDLYAVRPDENGNPRLQKVAEAPSSGAVVWVGGAAVLPDGTPLLAVVESRP